MVGCSGAKKDDNTAPKGDSRKPDTTAMDRPTPQPGPTVESKNPMAPATMAAKAGTCATFADCRIRPCCCGWVVYPRTGKTPDACNRKCKCKPGKRPRPDAVCMKGSCYRVGVAPVCKTKADCQVVSCRCGWLVWTKKLKKPEFCMAIVNCGSGAWKKPKPAFDCVRNRCVRK